MPEQYADENDDSFEIQGETKSSARVLSAIKKAERAFSAWQSECDDIDLIYAREDTHNIVWRDPDYDLFWSSVEILKPAIYAKPPVPVVSPQFKDRRQLKNVTAELLERTAISAFDRTDLDEGMMCVRDDLIFYNRGQLWVTYEKDDDGERVCVDHVDRKDFLHPPARKWSEVPWVARRAWLTKAELRKRFRKTSGDEYKNAVMSNTSRGNEYDSSADQTKKAGVWEVWHKADKKVYWVAEGVPVMLDEDEPHLKLRGFFPCPRPAYGTLKARTLQPVPDYRRYSGHFRKIDQLTRRIYSLLDQVRMKGLIPAGGDVGEAVESLMAEDRADTLLIPVPGAALTSGSGNFVQWLPIDQIAIAIQGLIEARGQLIEDFYQLSGISDIMRGATEAEETLGAQRLKSQYGSVRVREKIEELQRIAADITQISAEIMAENFSKGTLLEMSQMEIPSKSDIQKRVKELEADAREELEALAQSIQQPSPDTDPQMIQQQFQMQQQGIVAKYAAQIKAVSDTVPIEAVMDLLRDDKARGFAFEIATDSTILTDEIAEKQSRAEFMQVFTQASQGLMALTQAGPEGAKLAGEMLKFALQPYRVGRELNGIIDDFIDAAPKLADEAGEDDGLAEAQMALANAEAEKARAQMAKVEADSALKQAELETKMQQMQMDMQEKAAKLQLENQKVEQKNSELALKFEEMQAKVDNIRADTMKKIAEAGVMVENQALDEFKSLADIDLRANDQDMRAVSQAQSVAMSERQQSFNERSAMNGDGRE